MTHSSVTGTLSPFDESAKNKPGENIEIVRFVFWPETRNMRIPGSFLIALTSHKAKQCLSLGWLFVVFPLSGSSFPCKGSLGKINASTSRWRRRTKDKNTQTTTTSDPRHVTFTRPYCCVNRRSHILCSYPFPNRGNKWQLMMDSKSRSSLSRGGMFNKRCKYFAFRVTRFFYFPDTASDPFSPCPASRRSLSAPTFYVSFCFSYLHPLPPLPSPLSPSLSSFLLAAASPRPSPSACRSSRRGGCSLAVMTWETIMAAIM